MARRYLNGDFVDPAELGGVATNSSLAGNSLLEAERADLNSGPTSRGDSSNVSVRKEYFNEVANVDTLNIAIQKNGVEAANHVVTSSVLTDGDKHGSQVSSSTSAFSYNFDPMVKELCVDVTNSVQTKAGSVHTLSAAPTGDVVPFVSAQTCSTTMVDASAVLSPSLQSEVAGMVATDASLAATPV